MVILNSNVVDGTFGLIKLIEFQDEKKSKVNWKSNRGNLLVSIVNISGPKFSIDGTELNSTDLIDDDIDTCVELTGYNGCSPNKVSTLTKNSNTHPERNN